MSQDFEELVNKKPDPHTKIEGVEPTVFNYMRTLVGDVMLSSFQAQQLLEDLKGSYRLYEGTGDEIAEEDLSINLKDEVHQQILLLKALRKALFFESGAPRPDTEAAEIRGYLASSIQLLNLLQRFEEALKTDDDVRAIELALEDALEIVAEAHPDTTIAIDFVEVVAKKLGIADLASSSETSDSEEEN